MEKAILTEQSAMSAVAGNLEHDLCESAGGVFDSAVALEIVASTLRECLDPDGSGASATHICQIPCLGEVSGLQISRCSLQTGVALEVVFNGLLRRERTILLEARFEGCDLGLLKQLREDGLKIVSSRVLGFESDSKTVNLEVVPEIPVSLRFTAAGKDVLDVWLVNVDGLGARRYSLNAGRVDESFCAGLKAFILEGSPQLMEHMVFSGEVCTLHALDQAPCPKSEGHPDNVVSFERHRLRPDLTLILKMGGLEYQVRPGSKGLRLGRGLGCKIRIEALSVSREHATLVYEKGGFYLRDSSSNGTFIQQRGKPELFIHKGVRKLGGEGVIALGSPTADPESTLIRYQIEAAG